MSFDLCIPADTDPEGSGLSKIVIVHLPPDRANLLLDLRVPFETRPEHPLVRPREFSFHWYDFIVIDRGDFLFTGSQDPFLVEFEEFTDSAGLPRLRIGRQVYPSWETSVPRVVTREEHCHFRVYLRNGPAIVSDNVYWPVIEKLAGLPCT